MFPFHITTRRVGTVAAAIGLVILFIGWRGPWDEAFFGYSPWTDSIDDLVFGSVLVVAGLMLRLESALRERATHEKKQ